MLLLLLLHKNTDYYRPDIFEKNVACTEKNKFVDGKEIYGKFYQSEISSVARLLNFRNDQILSETVKLVSFLVVYWRSPHRRPPANVPRLGQPTWSGPTQLPPASLSPKKLENMKSVLFYKRKKSLLLLTPIFSLISSSSNGYSCYVIFPLDSINDSFASLSSPCNCASNRYMNKLC